MRILFCGSGEFAVPSLRAVMATDHELAGVVTQPARPAGRGGGLRPTPVFAAAAAAELDTTTCDDINAPAVVRRIGALKLDAICVVDFGQMIRQSVRATAAAAFNLHASLLPALRGAAPVNWAIIRGHSRTGVTTFRLVDEMDAGPIYVQTAADIRPGATAGELKARLADLGARAVVETLDVLSAGGPAPSEQDHTRATRAPRMTKADGLVDFAADARTARNLIHGTWPWPGARALLLRAAGPDVDVVLARAAAEAGPPGRPGRLDDQLRIETGGGRLEVLEIKPAGKRLMGWRDFVNGYSPAGGDRFVRPEG